MPQVNTGPIVYAAPVAEPMQQNGQMTEVEIRRITTADAGRARALRLEMLAEEPLAFITTLAEAAARPHADFAAFVARSSTGSQNAIFIALHGNRIVGQAGGATHPQSRDKTIVYAVYVAPDFRGSGVIGRLIDAVAAWSREAGRSTLELEVVTTNERARRAYLKLGFVQVGVPVPHPTVPIMRELVLNRSV